MVRIVVRKASGQRPGGGKDDEGQLHDESNGLSELNG